MKGLNSVGRMGSPTKMYVCNNCDSYGCGDYLFKKECPYCHYPLFENDFIYMPNFNDAYELARLRSIKNKAKKLGFDDDDDSSI